MDTAGDRHCPTPALPPPSCHYASPSRHLLRCHLAHRRCCAPSLLPHPGAATYDVVKWRSMIGWLNLEVDVYLAIPCRRWVCIHWQQRSDGLTSGGCSGAAGWGQAATVMAWHRPATDEETGRRLMCASVTSDRKMKRMKEIRFLYTQG
jgi:hypothetical protein